MLLAAQYNPVKTSKKCTFGNSKHVSYNSNIMNECYLSLSKDGFLDVSLDTRLTEQVAFIALDHHVEWEIPKTAPTLDGLSFRLILGLI